MRRSDLFELTLELLQSVLQLNHLLLERLNLCLESLDPFVFGSYLKGGRFACQRGFNGVQVGLPGQKMHESALFVTGLPR